MSNKKNIQHEKLKVLQRWWKWFSVSYWGIMREMKNSSLWECEIVISLALWDILWLGTKLCLIKSKDEILPLASTTVFFLSSQRNATFQLTIRVPGCTGTRQLSLKYHLCISVFACIYLCKSFLSAGMEEKYFLFVKIKGSLINKLQHRKVLLYMLSIVFLPYHFVNDTIKSITNK